MGEIIRPPIAIEIAGTLHQFEYEHTVVYQNRYIDAQHLNRIEAVQHGTQIARIFDCVNTMMFLTGVELPGHDLKGKQLKHILTGMDATVGWNAKLVTEDEPEDREMLEEKYIKLATVALRKEVCVYPKSWNKGTT